MSSKRQEPEIETGVTTPGRVVIKPVSGEATQRTPEGLEIPVPKRRDVMDALRKLVQPRKD